MFESAFYYKWRYEVQRMLEYVRVTHKSFFIPKMMS